MQIFIKSLSNEQGILEWTMIELQGDLEEKGGDDLSGKLVGDLFYKDGVPTFVIGHHILEGKAEALEKPFAVLEKRSEDLSGRGGTKTEYIVKALIKRKLIFKERPKPIVGIQHNPLHK